MGIKKRGLIILCSILLMFPFGNHTAIAQENNQSLLTVITQLEELFEVRFSYASRDIENVTVNRPDYDKPLPEILETLNKSSSLYFKFIDERYIAITQNPDAFITLCGQLINGDSGFPLEGASIQVQGSGQATVSDTNGAFTLQNVQNTALLEIRYIGFETLTVNAGTLQEAEPCPSITVQPIISQLEDVVLKDIFTRGINKNKDGSVTMQVEVFGNLPGLTEPDVLHMIQALPGVVSADETISNINIRGGTTDENLILWDDIKMYQNGHFFGMISGFNPYLTNKVTFFKNGTPARFGESVSGVVAMHASDEIPEKTTMGFQLNMINFGAFAKIPVNDKLAIHVSGRRSFTDLFKSPAYTRLFDKVFQDTEITNLQNTSGTGDLTSEEDFSFYDFSLKTIYKASEKDRFRVNFLTIDNKLDFTETFTTQALENSETSELNQRSIAGGISWNRQWKSNVSTNALVYGSYYLLDASNLDIFSTQQFDQTNEVLETGTKLDVKWKWIEDNELTAGYHFNETGITNSQEVNIPQFRNYVKEVLRNHALFLSNFLEIPTTHTSINAGLRLNHLTKFKRTLVEPRLNVHQKLGNGFAVEGAYEQKSQTVTQRIDFQSDFLGVEKRRWALANDESVPVLTSRQYSLTLIYQKNKWLLQAEGYSKDVEGITTANQGFQNQLQFIRTTGSYNSNGLEFIINKKTKNWSTWFSYTYANTEYTFENLDPETFPHNFDITHQASLATSYSIQNFKLAGGINWHSGRPLTLPLGENAVEINNGEPVIQYNTPNEVRNDDFFRVDLSAEYDFKIGPAVNGKLNAAVLNVTNRKNVLNTYFVTETNAEGEPEINRVEQLSLGLTPNVSLQVIF
jgi:hypothetical protein